MLIVSQNKDVIVNLQRVNFIKIEPDENEFDIEINYGDDYWDVIGSYVSYEKCKEILNAIKQEFKRGKSRTKSKAKSWTHTIPRQ